jgi:hypothetical protein
MSKWQDNQKKSSFDWRKKVGALIQSKTAELQKLTESEKHRLENLQGLLRQLKRANTFYSLFDASILIYQLLQKESHNV